LFIVGLSLPFAILNKMGNGVSTRNIVKYILSRSFALLVMGFYQVNMENYDKHNWFPLPVWAILVTFAFFLIWLDYRPDMNKKFKYSLVTFGYLILIAMAVVYKGIPDEDSTYTGISPQWWGILGLIGWAYGVSALVFVLTKGKLKWLICSLAVFAIINLVIHVWFKEFRFWIIGDASCVTLAMAGVVISIIYREYHNSINKITLITGLVLIAAGLLIRPYSGGISKIYSTPAWIFICSGISSIVFSLFIYLIDKRGKQNWFKIIRPAGTSTLTCYLIPYFLLFFMIQFDIEYPDVLNYGAGGIARSFGICFVVVFIVWVLEKYRLRLKV
jgi:heparan-alpha-glucosaminide N-acetyltransferase